MSIFWLYTFQQRVKNLYVLHLCLKNFAVNVKCRAVGVTYGLSYHNVWRELGEVIHSALVDRNVGNPAAMSLIRLCAEIHLCGTCRHRTNSRFQPLTHSLHYVASVLESSEFFLSNNRPGDVLCCHISLPSHHLTSDWLSSILLADKVKFVLWFFLYLFSSRIPTPFPVIILNVIYLVI